MSEQKNIYFVSDVHLGAPAMSNNKERELLFVHWLDEIKEKTRELFLMGDIFDFWYEYKKVVPRGFTRTLGKLAEFTDAGIPVHFFPGNHDLWAFNYFEEELGIKIHREILVKNFAGKKFVLAHGDGLDETDKGYNRLKKIFTNPTMQWLFSRLHPNFAFLLAHAWSKSSRLSKLGKEEEVIVKNEGIYKFAEKYYRTEKADYFIFGHRHWMTAEKIGKNSTFVFLGDWVTRFSYGVFDGERFELKNINKKKDIAAD